MNKKYISLLSAILLVSVCGVQGMLKTTNNFLSQAINLAFEGNNFSTKSNSFLNEEEEKIKMKNIISSANKKPRSVMLLNGISSSGKSTIQKELSSLLGEKWVTLSMDNYVIGEFKKMFPDIQKKSEFEIDQCIAYFLTHYLGTYISSKKTFKTIINDINNYLNSGKNVIIDLILYRDMYDLFENNLGANCNFIKVMIYCPLDVLVNRVNVRNKLASASNADFAKKLSKRTVARVIWGFSNLYQVTKCNGIVYLDRQQLDNVLEEATKDFLPEKSDASDFNTFSRDLYKKLGFDNEMAGVALQLANKHDIIINNGTTTAFESAKNILKKLNEKY